MIFSSENFKIAFLSLEKKGTEKYFLADGDGLLFFPCLLLLRFAKSFAGWLCVKPNCGQGKQVARG